jgi:LysM repeat protein
MQNIRFIPAAFFALAGFFAHGQNKEVIIGYINTYKDMAIAEMQRTGVPASIKLAQGIHETLAGTSELVMKSNNHFGIKCKATWRGPSVSHDDDRRGECFRKYGSSADSYRDHSDFLKGSPRYSSLFKLNPLDYSAWAFGLKSAGYATNPKYPQVIIKLIEDYNLQEYTLVALGKAAPKEDAFASLEPSGDETPVNAVTGPAVTAEMNAGEGEPVSPYPAGEFKINETRVIFARKGTPVLTIARQYNISLARLFEFNDMKEKEELEKDQLIYLQRKRKTGNNEFHVVKAQENLHDIAQEEAIRLEALLEYNLLESYMKPVTGTRLYLKSKAPSRPTLTLNETGSNDPAVFASNDNAPNRSTTDQPNTTTDSYTLLVVRPGETLYSISKKYNVRIADIAEWNSLGSYELKPGRQLRIYK